MEKKRDIIFLFLNEYKYFCLKIFRKVSYWVNNCKIQIWNKISYYEVQITHFSTTNDEINKKINSVLSKYNLIKFMYGHGNIDFEMDSSFKIMNIDEIILETTKIFYNKDI
jgi:hypothetical protein